MDRIRGFADSTPAMVSVLSGKGGVGKSVISLNLADQLAKRGLNVLLIDADGNTGTLHVLTNVSPNYGIGDYVAGRVPLNEAIVPLTENLYLLPATQQHLPSDPTDSREASGLVTRIQGDARSKYHIIVIDHGSGSINHSATLAHASDFNLIITIPELTSITGSYALYKFLVRLNRGISAGLIVNRAQNEDEVDFLRTRFNELSNNFLGVSPRFLGAVYEHESVRRSIASQCLLSQVDGSQELTAQLQEIAKTLAGSVLRLPDTGHFDINSTINKSPATADTRG